jgi:hypothetical protein
MPGPQTFAVDDPHTAQAPIQCIREEVPQGQLRLRDRQPVQIDLRLHAILSAAKLPQDRHLHTGAVVDELIAGSQLRVTRFAVETFEQYRVSIRATEAGDGHGPTPARFRSLTARQPFDILYRLSEKPNIIFVVGCGAHATSAESGSSIVAASRASTPPSTPL